VKCSENILAYEELKWLKLNTTKTTNTLVLQDSLGFALVQCQSIGFQS